MKKSQILVRLLTIAVLVMWILFSEWEFWEPVLGIVTILAYLATEWYNRKAEEAEYSPADALAFGYVNNFLVPVITQLLENDNTPPKICIYRPDKIEDLLPENIDRIKAEIKNRSFNLSEVQLDLKQGRARDILTIEQSRDQRVYFDFPNTLISLIGFVEYKTESVKNQSMEERKKDLGEKLISKFFSKVEEISEKRSVKKYIYYTDATLDSISV